MPDNSPPIYYLITGFPKSGNKWFHQMMWQFECIGGYKRDLDLGLPLLGRPFLENQRLLEILSGEHASLDDFTKKLLNPAAGNGLVEGRMALFDLLTDSRWGGLISGDKVTLDFTTADGFAGPLVRSVARYQDLEEGEDKLTCAGTIDSYVRGAVNL